MVRQIIDEQASQGRLRHFRSIASTGGLVDLVCEFISELKRLEIWHDEFHRACEARGIDDKDVELFEIYAAYQQALQEHNVFDAEGRFWSARDVLQKGQDANSKAGRAEQLVVIDGFTDFTRTQHEIIEILAGRAQQTIVTLPLEPEPRRSDLFAKPLKTLANFGGAHPKIQVEELPRATTVAWPAMGHLEQKLFVNPRVREAGDKDRTDCREIKGIEILTAARQLGEIELVGEQIKRLLVDGEARPGDIAVVFRLPQDVGGLLGEVLNAWASPSPSSRANRSTARRRFALSWHWFNWTSTIGRSIKCWPCWEATFFSLIGASGARDAWPLISNGRFARGRSRAARNRLIQQLVEADAERRGSLPVVADVVRRLADAFDALPERATLPDWGKAWRRLANETGLLRAMDGRARDVEELDEADDGSSDSQATGRDSAEAPFDRRAWNRLMESLDAGDKLAVWLERRPPELDRRAAIDALLDILHSEGIGHAGDESGCVRVLSASSARSLRIPYVFLAGLSEKVFPPPDREDRLYSEAETARLIEAGLPFVARTERTREEMLLFYEAITRAGKRLYLSYPAIDDAAQPLLPTARSCKRSSRRSANSRSRESIGPT